MFSKNTSIKPIINNQRSDTGYMNYTSYYNLPKQKVLLLTRDWQEKKTFLKIFSMHNLDNPLFEISLNGRYVLVCLLLNGTILIRSDRVNENQLLTLSPELGIIASQAWESENWPAAASDSGFFIIRREFVNSQDSNSGHFLSMYRWNNHCHEVFAKIPLGNFPEADCGYFENIQALGERRYCSHLRGYKNIGFSLLIFQITPENRVIEESIIRPGEKNSSNSANASGEYAVLADGKIVTYHSCHPDVKIWDTRTFTCIKKWKWNDIITSLDFQPYGLKIIPFPFPQYFLLHNGNNAYLFDLDKMHMKSIELPFLMSNVNYHILKDTRILVLDNDVIGLVGTHRIHLKEMLKYHEVIRESQLLARLFFNRKYLPVELCNHIFSYAFTTEARSILAKKVDEEDSLREERRCSIL